MKTRRTSTCLRSLRPNAEDATAEVTVTVLNKGALALVCTDAYGSVYEGSEDHVTTRLFGIRCSFGDNPQYAYAWTARGNTSDTSLLSAADIASPVFYVPDEVGRGRDVRVHADGECGECGICFGRGYGDGAEQGAACFRG